MDLSATFDAVLEEIIFRWGIPGLGIGIVKDGEVVYARGFGVQSLDTRVPVTPESIFCVASIAKCFVACAMMQLVEQGTLSLDAPLAGVLPEFRLDDDRYQEITLRQVLSHTSGMPDMEDDEYNELVYHPEVDDEAPGRYVRALSSRRMIAAPGERFAYSNIGYDVLGYLVASVTGQTFETAMQEHILRPAGMLDSTFSFPEVPRDRLAVPHLRTPEMIVSPVYPYHRADAPASFLHSTVGDMCRWAIACLNRGSYEGRRILAPASYDLMWTPVAPWGFPPFYEHIGVGWTLGHFDGLRTVSHGGMGFGWTDFLILLPERNCGAVILCNEESSARSRTVRAVVHAMLGRDPEVGTVSWMVPICRALEEGGIEAAYACFAEIKDDEAYFIDEGELYDLTYQLLAVGNVDLAIDVLKLNLAAFPHHESSCLRLSELYNRRDARRCAMAPGTAPGFS
ncbi:MAG: beta-lactamase family protein [Anaerolineae bacterium]|nr:beta-lactamase family protein [Anaerolineae bacterium]